MPRTAPTTPAATETLYHGTNRLFGRFDMAHAFEGAGKSKFGLGINLAERAAHALVYAVKIHRARPGDGCFVYKVEAPALEPGNHIWIQQPVEPSVAARVREALGLDLPEETLADGNLFRKFVACRLEGMKRKKSEKPTFAGEKAAAAFFDRLGIVCVVWPLNWKKKDNQGRFLHPFDRVVFDAAKVRVVSVDRYDEAGNVVETIAAKDLPQG